MGERIIAWLAQKASDYLVWVHEREVRNAPTCPDCESPEPDCWCDERSRLDRIGDSAYDAGFEAGYERAERAQSWL